MAHRKYKRKKAQLSRQSTSLLQTSRRCTVDPQETMFINALCSSRDDPRFQAVLDDRLLIYDDSSRAMETRIRRC